MSNASRNEYARTGGDIRSNSSTCLELLESCFYKTEDAELEAKVEASERRFRSWTNKVRVFGRNGRCLDTQLRSDKEEYIREMILALLNVLRGNLSALELAVKNNVQTPIAEVKHLLYGIDGSLQRLAKIAHALLVSIQPSLTRRVVSFAKRQSLHRGVDDYSGLDNIGNFAYHVSEVIHERFELLRLHEPRELADTRRQFQSTLLLPSSTCILQTLATEKKVTREAETKQDAKEEDITENKVTGDKEWKEYWHNMASIVKTMIGLSDDEAKSGQQLRAQGLFTAIVRSCVFRNCRILYERDEPFQEPEARKEQPMTAVETPPTPDVEDQGQTHEYIKIGAPSEQKQEVQSSGPPTVDHSRYRGALNAEGSSYMGTDIRAPLITPSEAGVGYYPRAPRVNDVNCAECPICKKMIPAIELEGDGWIRHVDKDILPFVCVLDGCMSELRFFPSRQSWARHMHTAHTTSWLESLHNGYYGWGCSICRTSSTSKSPSKADMEDDFCEHVRTNHLDVLPSLADARLLATISCFPLPLPKDTCPICAQKHSTIAVLDEDNHPTAPTAADTALGSESKAVRFAEDTNEEPNRHSDLDLSRVEKCVARHLKALALYFLNSLLDDTVLDADGPPSHVVDAGSSHSKDGLQDVPGVSVEFPDINVPDVPTSPTAGNRGGRDPADLDEYETDPEPPDIEGDASESHQEMLTRLFGPEKDPLSENPSLEGLMTLDNLINGALIESAFPPGSRGQNFAPRSTLNHVTKSSVSSTLWPSSTSSDALVQSDKELVEFISEQAREIFAIGICMNISKEKLRRVMQCFMAQEISDKSLPISNAQIDRIWAGDQGSRRSFKDSQHFFRPYNFPKKAKFSVITLQPNIVLPVLESVQVSEGHFGIVFKVKLHQESLDVDHPIHKTQCWAAIKQLQASNENEKARKAWNREVNALQKICQLDLPNVVEIIAMMTIGKQQYFVFPWARGGNLRDFWDKNNNLRSDIARRYIPDIIEQLVGLASALATLHNFQHSKAASYRHGDLKPENILVFDNDKHSLPGIWKLTDLGLARYHMNATGDRHYVTSTSGAGTISYQPPESRTSRAAPATTRLYDIWGMGCIMLQLMTWLLYGNSRVETLTKTTMSIFMDRQSSYWNGEYSEKRGFHSVKIHSNVKSLMSEMRYDTRNSKALQDILSIIEDKLLVVQLPRKSLVPEQGCRTNAADLYQSLLRVQNACKDKDYWFHRDIMRIIERQRGSPQVQ